MRVKELQEGFLDNIMSKIKVMAGGDGITGFFRSLRGSNARLDLVIDAIAGETERMLKQGGQTNLGTGSAAVGSDIPVDKIILAAFSNAARLSKNQTTEIGTVTRDGLFAHLKQHKTDILRGINSLAAEQAKAGQMANLVLQFLQTKKVPDDLDPNMDVSRYINAVSTIAAVTLLDWEFREMVGAGKGLNTADAFSFDSAEEQAFDQAGKKINQDLFTPGSNLHVQLKANQNFKTNLEELVVTGIMQKIKTKYVDMPTEQLKNAAASNVDIVDRNQIQAAFFGHLNAQQASEFKAAATKMVAAQTKRINAFLKQWLELAVKERDATNEETSAEAFSLLHKWATGALELVSNIRFAEPKADAKQKQAGKDIPPAGETTPEQGAEQADLEASTAAAKLKQNPGEDDQAFAQRKGKEYEKVFADYFEKNPPT